MSRFLDIVAAERSTEVTFQAKSTAAMLGILTVVYGCYFVIMFSVAGRTPVDQIVYQPVMIIVTIPLVILAILVHIVIAITAPSEVDVSDERDRIIALRGEAFGGLVLGVGVFCGLVLVMFGGHSFWIAHALLGSLVVAEMASAVLMLVLYRRGG
jgi:hypothetical protein